MRDTNPIPEPAHDARAVFEILVREHADMLTLYIRSIVRDPGSIDDLFQETMLVAWRRLADYDRTRPFAPWLRGIAAKLALARHRERGRLIQLADEATLAAIDERFDTLARRPGDTFRDRIGRVALCITRLPEDFREVIDMAYTRGMQLRQIADALELNEETVKKRIQRARRVLADCVIDGEPA